MLTLDDSINAVGHLSDMKAAIDFVNTYGMNPMVIVYVEETLTHVLVQVDKLSEFQLAALYVSNEKVTANKAILYDVAKIRYLEDAMQNKYLRRIIELWCAKGNITIKEASSLLGA